MIDMTGETEIRQQVEGIVLRTVPIKQGPVSTADYVPVYPTGGRPFGVNAFLQWQPDPERLVRSFDLMRAAGVTWIRQQFPWSDIEIPSKNQYVDIYGRSTWEKYDRIVESAERSNIQLLVRLDFPPDWARRDNQNTFAPPDRYADYGDYVETVARRYRGRIHHYQIWNEPNTDAEWGPLRPNPREYAQLLKIAWERLKMVDPEIVVHAAPLAPTLGTPDGKNVSDLEFLQGMYAAGAADWFDVMGVMAYGLWTGPGDRRVEPGRVNFSRPELIRDLMVRNGDARKPLWAAEVGWNALPADWPDPATHGQVSLAQQADYAEQAYLRALHEWPWMGVMFYWHFGLPYDENRDQQMFYFRMADPDLTTMPVFDAFRKVATGPARAGLGRHFGDHWAVNLQGAAERTARATRIPAGSSVNWSFSGEELRIRVSSREQGGMGTLTVASLPPDQAVASRATVVRRTTIQVAGSSAPTGEIIVRGLPPGEYRAALDAGAGVIELNEFAVYERSLPWQSTAVGTLLLVVIVAGVSRAVRH